VRLIVTAMFLFVEETLAQVATYVKGIIAANSLLYGTGNLGEGTGNFLRQNRNLRRMRFSVHTSAQRTSFRYGTSTLI
jgi:hypothetical protein